ncbi:MAG: ATP-dependent sacrificial sulfur transferase LarE [Candidatus Omnitrophota bacterium]
MSNHLDEKYQRLQAIFREIGSVVIGYSGGVDSAFLAKAATDVLGDRALCVAAVSGSYPEFERREAEKNAREMGLNFECVTTSELDDPNYRKNAADRCYFCKKELVSHLQRIAQERGYRAIAVGTNLDDLGDYRPGQQAVKEGGARNPLVEAGLTKEDIRLLSKRLNIPTWNKPAFACLSSRFPYGEEITPEKLRMVEQAEDYLRQLGFQQYRVRHHHNLARIETPPDAMPKILENREEIYRRFREIGYAYISLDLMGYRQGSMNETLIQIGKSPSIS